MKWQGRGRQDPGGVGPNAAIDCVTHFISVPSLKFPRCHLSLIFIFQKRIAVNQPNPPAREISSRRHDGDRSRDTVLATAQRREGLLLVLSRGLGALKEVLGLHPCTMFVLAPSTMRTLPTGRRPRQSPGEAGPLVRGPFSRRSGRPSRARATLALFLGLNPRKPVKLTGSAPQKAKIQRFRRET